MLAQARPCKEGKVTYDKPLPELVQKISLKPAKNKALPPDLKTELTPQSTRWFASTQPDYLKTGPWNSTIYVGSAGSVQPTLRLTVSDHGNTLTIDWITEKLLHLSVWWGRIASSEIIVDVEKGTIIYHELANYGQIVFCNEVPR
jgi:hypothetical protein